MIGVSTSELVDCLVPPWFFPILSFLLLLPLGRHCKYAEAAMNLVKGLVAGQFAFAQIMDTNRSGATST